MADELPWMKKYCLFNILKSWNDTGVGACLGSWVGIKCAQGQVILIKIPLKGLSGRLSEKNWSVSSSQKT